jgi:hypothetical protein
MCIRAEIPRLLAIRWGTIPSVQPTAANTLARRSRYENHHQGGYEELGTDIHVGAF